MGRQRTIDDAEFWRSPRMANLSQEDKATLQYLLTSPYSNIIGVYQIVPRIAASEMGWNDGQLIAVLERLEKLELIRFDEASGFIWVRIWWFHNKLKAAFDGNVKKMAYSQLRKVPDHWLEDIQKWIIFHDERAVFTPIGRPLEGASEGLAGAQVGATTNPTLTNISTTTCIPALLNGGGTEVDIGTLVDAAMWSASKAGSIHNEGGYRSAIKARIQQAGPSAEDLLTLKAWRDDQARILGQEEARKRQAREAEDNRSAHLRDTERINAAFNLLSLADQASILEGFQIQIASTNPMVFSLLKKQGVKSPVVQAAFTEFLRTVPNLNRETTAA